MCALSKDEYDKVCACEAAKEMWDSQATTHEAPDKVKETKINMVVRKYELFKMEEWENIVKIFGRFQTTTNSLKSLRNTYKSKEHLQKLLRSLPK